MNTVVKSAWRYMGRLALILDAIVHPTRFFIVEIEPADAKDLFPFIEAMKTGKPSWWSFEKYGVEGITFVVGGHTRAIDSLTDELRSVTE